MKITYIYHSSFCVEFENQKIVLIFDYYKGKLPIFNKDSHIFMFASHKHFDHYSKNIFDLGNEYENITFVLSKEIKMTEKYMDKWNIPIISRGKTKYVTYNEKYNFLESSDGQSLLEVNTLKSTDSGVAFIVKCFGKTLYHAGDLNWWIWNGDSEEKNLDMTERFQEEIGKITDLMFDVAFLPLDSRQEDKFYLGFDYFMKNCNVDVAFPMHLWGKYETINDLKKMETSIEYRNKIIDINEEGQVFEL